MLRALAVPRFRLLLPFVRLARAGRRKARTVVTWLAGSGMVLHVGLVIAVVLRSDAPWSIGQVALVLAGLAVVAAVGVGVRLLHTPEVESYLVVDSFVRHQSRVA